MTQIEKIFNDFKSLTEEEKATFLLSVIRLNKTSVDILGIKKEVKELKVRECPHCKGTSILAIGKNKGVQRYRCKSCGKNFSENTGTSLAHLKKAYLWDKYIGFMLEGHSIRKCAELTGISIQTSFDWRHKVLSSLKSMSPEKFQGITESDDLFFNYSEKGFRNLKRKPRKRGNDGIKQGVSNDKVAVILTCDRKQNKDIQVAKRGRLRKCDIEKVLKGKLDVEAVLCTDSHRSYTAFAKSEGIKHEKLNARKKQYVKDKIYHVQNANQTISALRNWMVSFNGVSTKYLQNYLSWFMVLEQIKDKNNKIREFAFAALISTNAWFLFKNLALFNI